MTHITHEEYSRNSYPSNFLVLDALPNPAQGHLLCRIYWATNLKDGVCRMGLNRLGHEIGFSKSTASRARASLLKDKWVEMVRPGNEAKNEPPHYRVTTKFWAIFDAVPERNTPVPERNTPVPERNTPVPERNQEIESDLESEIEKVSHSQNSITPKSLNEKANLQQASATQPRPKPDLLIPFIKELQNLLGLHPPYEGAALLDADIRTLSDLAFWLRTTVKATIEDIKRMVGFYSWMETSPTAKQVKQDWSRYKTWLTKGASNEKISRGFGKNTTHNLKNEPGFNPYTGRTEPVPVR